MSYSQLPTELKFNILSHTKPHDLYTLETTSFETTRLIRHVIYQKLHYYLSSEQLLVSLYSSNNKEATFKNFYTLNFEITTHSTKFSIGQLHHKENLLQNPHEKSAPSTSSTQKNHIDLILNEDQSFIKTSVNFLRNKTSIHESSIRIPKFSSTGIKKQDGLKLQYVLTKGEMEPAKGGYDFDESFNYALNFGQFEIENLELLKNLEGDESFIVRY